MSAAFEVVRDALSQLRRKVAFHVVGDFVPDVAAVDVYDLGWRQHRSSEYPMRRWREGYKGNFLENTGRHCNLARLAFRRSESRCALAAHCSSLAAFETFSAFPNPTAT